MVQTSFQVWSYLFGGALAVGIIGLIVGEIHTRLSRQASGATTMVESPAMVEQAANGTWTASIVRGHSVLGTGATRKDALDDLRKGVAGLGEYLKRIPQSK